MLQYKVLDRRQVVRQRVLVPSFAGSNPAGPATGEMTLGSFFEPWIVILATGKPHYDNYVTFLTVPCLTEISGYATLKG